MIFKDTIKLAIELQNRGVYPYNILKAIRLFSDNVTLDNKNDEFVEFNYCGIKVPIKVIPIRFIDYNNYGNEYNWELN